MLWNKSYSLAARKPRLYCSLTNRIQTLGSLSMNGTKLELSNEARLLGVTLDSKLTWKPHITRITRKATTALMQCRQIVGKTWGITPSMMKLDIHSCDMPTMSNACVFWAGGLNKKYLVRKLTKMQRLACLMILSAFPGTSTGAPEILLNITPILRNFYWLRQCEVHTESLLVGSGMSTQLVPLGKQKAHVDVSWVQ